MVLIGLLLTSLLTFIITGFMLYVAMVTGIGPWIGPVTGILIQGVSSFFSSLFMQRMGFLITVSSSVGGIIGTAFGFSFPTWFFLEKDLFMDYVANHTLAFFLLIISVVVVAGLVGTLSSDLFYKELVEEKNLPFPVGTMTYQAIMHHNPQEKKYMFSGIALYAGYSLLFIKRFLGKWVVPLQYSFYSGFTSSWIAIPAFTLDFSIVPLLISIGFVAGSIMALPLAIGALMKMSVLNWLYNYYSFLPNNDFLFAFCSGIVLSGTVGSLLQQLYSFLKAFYNVYAQRSLSYTYTWQSDYKWLVVLGVIVIVYARWYQFSLLGGLYLFVTTLLCAYQISFIAGKIGLALLGRFATFVMVPGVMLFNWNPLQITLVATFVELVGGIAVDNLQGKKTFQLAHMNVKDYRIYHYVALLAAALATAVCFYYFVMHYQLGSSLLCAQRAQARALLLQVATVNMQVLVWGICGGLVLKYFSCNPILVLSGLLMPFSSLVPLTVGGLCALIIKDHKKYESFFSGVYVANACLSVIRMFL